MTRSFFKLSGGLGAAGVLLAMSGAFGYSGDAPEISRSRGARDGIVVLWPRVVPADPALDAMAADVQAKLAAAAASKLGADPEVRPSPERACPQEGCRAAALGAVILHAEGGCAVVATFGAPDRGAVRLVPWGGKVEITKPEIGFRDPPESGVTIVDFSPCSELAGALDPAALASGFGS